ncbi:MAG: hypothetical protein JWM50_2212 [Microbacteriaceae bacterium]|nr:hypothetical protein [Microbacteriaceae bacterium]
MSGTEVRAMARIAEADGITPKRLAELLEFTGASVTFVTSALAEKGLVERVPHPEDRRSLLLRTTTLGDKVANRMYDHFSSEITEASRSVEGVDPRALQDALTQMAKRLAERVPAEG